MPHLPTVTVLLDVAITRTHGLTADPTLTGVFVGLRHYVNVSSNLSNLSAISSTMCFP